MLYPHAKVCPVLGADAHTKIAIPEVKRHHPILRHQRINQGVQCVKTGWILRAMCINRLQVMHHSDIITILLGHKEHACLYKTSLMLTNQRVSPLDKYSALVFSQSANSIS